MARFFSFRKWLEDLGSVCISSRKVHARNVLARNAIRPNLEELERRLAPATTLSIADTSAIEPSPHGTVNMNFTVTRTGDVSSQLTVGYKTVAGTAQPATDFTPMTGTTTFAAGSATATIGIPIFGNGVYNNPSLSFSVVLTGIVNVVGPPVTLANGQTFAAGNKPVYVAVADVNGDGKPDLIVANSGDNTVSVLLNTAAPGATTPSFATQQTFATGKAPQSVKVADVNGDGLPDLVVANSGDNTLSVLLNTTMPGATTPSFATQQVFATGTKPMAVAVSDVNGDGKPDLIVANSGGNTVSVLLNTTAPGATTPSFATQQTFATGNSPVSLAVADVNGDDKPDVIVANAAANTVSVLLNTTAPGATTPSFAAQQTFATGKGPQSISVTDLNGDGMPDLVVANSTDNTVSVLLNTAAPGATTPSFATQQTFATGSKPVSVVIGDVNGDGKRDLVVVNSGDNTVSVLLNTTAPGAATLSFATQQTFATGMNPLFVALNDVNGDGMPDLVVANSADGTVSVLLNTTAPGAAAVAPAFPEAATPAVGAGPFSVAVGDVNGDGKPDLVVANSADGTVSVLLNTTAPGAATPSFGTPKAFATGTYPVSLAMGDVNGDGKPDLVVVNEGDKTVSVLLNTTAPGATVPSFASQKTFSTGSYPVSVAMGDVNGDGMPDLVVANQADNSVSVLLNTTAPGATTPSFAAQQTFAAGSGPISVAVADVNGDGLPDLVVANGGGNTISILVNATLPGASTAAFGAQQTFATGPYPVSVAVGDVNGDGMPDLVVTNFGFHFNPAHSVSVLLNKTAPGATVLSFATQQTFATGYEPCFVVLGDVNGDGKPDLIVADQASRAVSVLLNTTAPGATTPSFAAQQTFPAGGEPVAVALGDFNGDGLPDLAVANYSDKTVSVLLNTPVTITRGTATGTITESDAAPGSLVTSFVVAAPNSATTGSPFNITVTALDSLGNVATGYSGHVHFTSSDAAASLPVDSTLTGGVGTFTVTLKTAGSQTITATDTVSINPIISGTSAPITARGLTVTSLTPTATGFTAVFSKPFVPADLTLWGGTVAAPVQNVTLVGTTNGAVNGSLVVDPTNTSITFKASAVFLSTFFSSTVLPNDTWKVTLGSGTGTGTAANGFFDALGAALDGGNNGGHANYTTTFTTANDGKPALSIPDFARSPDRTGIIKVPNNSGNGIPVTLSNAAAVKDVVFTLSYNPTLFMPIGAGTGDSSGTGSTFTMALPTNIDATHATVSFTFHNGTAQNGTVILGDILGNVPNSAANQYQAKEIIEFVGSSITVNGAAFTGVWANGLHVNAYFGDVTGNGTITALDVATAANVAQGNTTSPFGLAAFRLVDPAVVGDIAGDASIDATAVSDLAAFTSNLNPAQIPVPPAGLTITPGGPDPTLSLGEPKGGVGRIGNPSGLGRISNPSYSGIISVPVMLDHPRPDGSTGMTEAILALTYDPSILSLSSADITLGSIPRLGTSWHLVSVVDQATGQIGIDLYSTTPITAAQAGSLVNIAFHVVAGGSLSATAVQLVNNVMSGGQHFVTQVDDAQGQLVLSPGIDRLVVLTGVGTVSAATPGIAGSARVAAANGRVSADGLAQSDSQEITATISLLPGYPAEDAGPFGVLSNGAAADEAPSVSTVPANLIAGGALAFQTDVTDTVDYCEANQQVELEPAVVDRLFADLANDRNDLGDY